jgi:hypothetical protein
MKNPFKAFRSPFNSWSRKDFFGKNEADGWEKALKKNRKISITRPQSSRWWIDDDDSTYYTTDQIGKSDAGYNISVNTITGEAEGEVSEARVDSTAIDLISYDPDTKALGITYKGGTKEYIFPDVPEEEFKALMNSASKGKYVQFVIKPKYSVNK